MHVSATQQHLHTIVRLSSADGEEIEALLLDVDLDDHQDLLVVLGPRTFALDTVHAERQTMVTSGLFVTLDAKPGKEEELAAFLKQGLALANAEVTTPVWFAVRFSKSRFAIFDAFRDEAGRQAHLDGPIAKALMAQAPTLLAAPPAIERCDIIGAKLP